MPSKPWQRIHIDFAGPFMGKMFLVIVCAHSKWPEVFPLTVITSAGTIQALRKCFAAYGIREQIVSDNGPQFIFEKFSHFTKGNGIKHIKCAPYHPSSNVAVERFIPTFKLALKARSDEKIPFDLKSASFLLTYLFTAHSTTGQSPASLFLGRSLCTRWDLLKPDIGRNVRIRTNLTRHTSYHFTHQQ